MQINLSLELTRGELEALQNGIISNTELLREPLEVLLPGSADKILEELPSIFEHGESDSCLTGVSWRSTLMSLLLNKFKIWYTLDVDDSLLNQIVSTSNYVVKDSVPVLNMYAQLLTTINNFRYSQSAMNSIQVLKNRLKTTSSQQED